MHGWRWPLVRWDGWAGGGREQKSEEDEPTTKTEATNKTIYNTPVASESDARSNTSCDNNFTSLKVTKYLKKRRIIFGQVYFTKRLCLPLEYQKENQSDGGADVKDGKHRDSAQSIKCSL